METLEMSSLAIAEFKKLLQENNIEEKTVRINLAGMGCGGPQFNIVVDVQNDNDEVILKEDLTFLINKEVLAQFAGFTLKCAEENGIDGFSLEPYVKVSGGCGGGCGGGDCHSGCDCH